MKLGVDIGGSYIKFGILDGTELIEEFEYPTPASKTPEDIYQLISKHYNRIEKKFEIESIGIGVPAPVPDSNIIALAPNLNNWDNIDLSDLFKNLSDKPIRFENDANCAAIAELKLGKGKELDEFLFVTLGTGIGGAIISDNKLVRGKYGSAGEIGHTIIKFDEEGDSHRSGIFEQYFSEKAFIERTKENLNLFPHSIFNEVEEFSVREISEAIRSGDDLAVLVFGEMGKILGKGLASAVNLLGITDIIIGGGISRADNYLFKIAGEELNKRVLPQIQNKVRITRSEFYNSAGVIGAGLL